MTIPSIHRSNVSMPSSPEAGQTARTPKNPQVPSAPDHAAHAKACTKLLDTRRSIMNRSGFSKYASGVGALAVRTFQRLEQRLGVIGPGSRADDGGGALTPPGVIGPGSRADDGGGALTPPA